MAWCEAQHPPCKKRYFNLILKLQKNACHNTSEPLFAMEKHIRGGYLKYFGE